MRAQVPITRLSNDAASNDALIDDGPASTSVPAVASTHASAVAAAVLLTASARLCPQPAPSNEPSLRLKRDDAGGWHTNAKSVLAASSGIGLPVFRSDPA